MVDQRVSEHAKIIVDYSCEVKKGDYVVISTNGVETLPLIKEIAGEIGRKGAHYGVTLQENSINRSYLINAEEETLSILPRQMKAMYEGLDVFIQINGTSNTRELSDVPPSKLKANAKSATELFPIILSKRWNVTLHPTPALAQETRKSYESY